MEIDEEIEWEKETQNPDESGEEEIEWNGGKTPLRASPRYEDVTFNPAKNVKRAVRHISTMAKNTPANLWENIKNVPRILDPNTWRAAKDVVVGGVNYGLRKAGYNDEPEDYDEATFRQGVVEPLKGVIKDPVGSLVQYSEEKPVNFMMDVSGGAGLLRKGAGAVGMVNAAANLGRIERGTSPVTAAMKPIEYASAFVRRKAGDRVRKLAESGLKIPPSVDKKIRDKAVNTAIEERYPLSNEGYEQMVERSRGLNRDVMDMVERHEPVAEPVFNQLNADVERISGEATELLRRVPDKEAVPVMPAVTQAEMNKLKRDMRVPKSTVLIGEEENNTPLIQAVRKGTKTSGMNVPFDFTVGDLKEMIGQVEGVIKETQRKMNMVDINTVNPEKVRKLQKELEEAVERAVGSGKAVDTRRVAETADALKEFYGRLPDGKKYVDQITEWQDTLVKEKGIIMSPMQAQRMKQAIYAVDRKAYGDLAGLRKEFDKAVARGLKNQLVEMIPALKGLNAEDSALINLEQFYERALNRSRNYDVVRLGDMIIAVGGEVAGSAAGGTIGGITGAITGGVVKHTLESPEFKMRLALALDKVSKKIPMSRKIGKKPLAANMYSHTMRVGDIEEAKEDEGEE